MTRPAATTASSPAASGAVLAEVALDELARLRLTGRLAVGFLLDVIAIARGKAHVLDTLLVSAVIQANVEEINRRGDLQVAFAQSDEPPPDELRRPVSMNALSSSLDLPFETVRRRIKALVRDGRCILVEGGVIVPATVLAEPQYAADAYRAFERIRQFYYQLRDLGLLRDLPPPTVSLSPNVFPIRAVARLAGTYVLRVVETLAKVGDLIDGLIVLEIFRSNVEHLAAEPGPAPGGMFGDDERRPIAVTRLAARIGVPQETVRRHVSDLMARGVVRRLRGGLIVPLEQMAGVNLNLRPAIEANFNNLHRLFAAYSQLGVLQVWDSAQSLSAA